VDPAHALWIGGPQGSGTASVARALAERFGLRLYAIDDRTQAHEERMPTVDERSTRASPEQTLQSFVRYARHRFRLVLEDLRELPAEPTTIVEGWQLFPTSVSAVLWEPDQALFLLPDRPRDEPIARTIEREARELRLPVLPVDVPLDELAERAAALLAPAVARLSAAAGTSPSRSPRS
jgi:hypothetical protein